MKKKVLVAHIMNLVIELAKNVECLNFIIGDSKMVLKKVASVVISILE